jgi:hypothetical protein
LALALEQAEGTEGRSRDNPASAANTEPERYDAGQYRDLVAIVGMYRGVRHFDDLGGHIE